ncbi:gasdermin-E [Hoplias malabaricus]|uniref:gasdermin-E n=1 Tax=Hoplias malabaricus TaxID=27720 RepID=UPI003462D52B
MFEKATHRLVQQIDRDGVLIAVSRVNDSKSLKPLSVVMKRPGVWFWQKTKYRPTTFTLNHLLQGDPIQPVLEETEFLNYKAKHESTVAGSMDAGIVGINMQAKGHGASKLSSCFGKLRKENVNMQSLLEDSKSRKMNLDHKLIQQTWKTSKKAFTLVVERIFTTCECTIEYSGVEETSCSTILQALGIYPAEVCLKDSGSLQFDSNVSIGIPEGTVMAYSVINLDIKSDGSCELSAFSDGFESDDDILKPSLQNEDEVDSLSSLPKIQKGSPLSVLKKALSDVKASLRVLTHLPAESRSSLLQLFHQILLDHRLLPTLEDKLEDLRFILRTGETSCFSHDDGPNKLIDKFLDLLQSPRNKLSTTPTSHNGYLPSLSHKNGAHITPVSKNRVNGIDTSSVPVYMNGSSSKSTEPNGSSMKSKKHTRAVLTAMHMLVTAAEGLTRHGLTLLGSLCSSEVLIGLNDLVNLLTDASEPLPIDSLPFPLQNEDVFLKVTQLFSSSKIMLKKEKMIWMEMECSNEHLPLLLCIVIHGLAYLSEA